MKKHQINMKLSIILMTFMVVLNRATGAQHGDSGHNHKMRKRSAISNETLLWPGGVVPYLLDNSIDNRLDEAQHKIIQEIFAEIHNKTCIKFKPRQNETDYIHIMKGWVTKQAGWGNFGGRQDFLLSSRKIQKSEYFRAFVLQLGFLPEIARLDLNKYLEFKKGNAIFLVDAPTLPPKYAFLGTDDLDVPYDYCSVLHDPIDDKYGYTITPLKPYNCSKSIGYATSLSQIDVLKINKLYKCP